MGNKDEMVDIFRQCGLALNDEKVAHNVLEVDQRRFQANLQKAMLKLKQAHGSSDYFTDMIVDYLENNENFLISLLPTRVSSDSVSAHSSFQDNLIKLLMEIDELQTFLFDYLLNKLVSVCDTSDELTSIDEILGVQIDVVTYIINQFRFQPRIIDPEGVCEKFIAAVKKIRSPAIKSEIVSCFPDILSDSSHDKITQDLEDLIDDPDLISVVLETHGSLKIKPENVTNMAERLFAKLDSVNQADLAAVVRYVLRSAVQIGSKEMLYELRVKLAIDGIKDAKARFQVFDVIRLCFQSSNELIDLYIGLVSQLASKEASASSLGVTRIANRSSSHLLKSVDLIIFAVLYSMASQAGRVDKLFQQVVREYESASSTKHLVQTTFKLGGEIARELFASMCAVARSLVVSASSSACLVASQIYTTAFTSMEPKYKLIVVNILVETAKNSNGPARDNALDTLIRISNRDTVSISSYTKQIRSLVDYIEYFSIGQIRKIYYIMCSVVYCSNASSTMLFSETISNSQASSVSFSGKDSSIQNDMNILINKQLTSNILKYKKIGVIGALMTIKNMASKISTGGAAGNASGNSKTLCEKSQASAFDFDAGIYCSQMPTSQIAEISISESDRLSITTVELKNIWNMVAESSRTCAESLGLFEDDLTSLIYKGSLPPCIEDLIKENLKKLVTHLFDIDNSAREKLNQQIRSFRVDYDYGIDQKFDGVLNLMPLIVNESQRKARLGNEAFAKSTACQLAPMTLAPTIRLMIALERHNLQDLEDYLSLPVFAVKKSDFYRYAGFSNLASDGVSSENYLQKFRDQFSDSERKTVCDTLFYLINWFIELVNGFSACLGSKRAGAERDSMRAKLVARMTTVIELQQILTKLLPHMKCYRAPMAVFGLVESSELPLVEAIVRRKEAAKKLKPKKKASKTDKKSAAKKPMKKKLNTSNPDEMTLIEDEVEDDDAMEEKELVESSDEQMEDAGGETYEIDSNKLAVFFREFDLEIINLIGTELDLNLDDKLNTNANNSSLIEQVSLISSKRTTNRTLLNPYILNYILTDLNAKFSFIFKAPAAASTFGPAVQPEKEQSKIKLFCELNAPSPAELARSFFEGSLEHVLSHLETIRQHFKTIQRNNDSIRDPAEVTNKPTNMHLLRCFNQMLKLLNTYFNWLQKNGDSETGSVDELITATIKKVAAAASAKGSKEPQQAQQAESFCFNFFYRLKDVALDLNTANLIVQILDVLLNKIFKDYSSLSEPVEAKIRATLVEACFELLQNEYSAKFHGVLTSKQANNEAVDNILKTVFSNYGDKSIELMIELCRIISSTDFKVDRDCSGKYRTLRTNFPTYYRILLEKSVALVKQVKKRDHAPSRDIDRELERIKQIVYIHSTLVMLKKDQEGSFRDINTLTALKNSKLFLMHFMKNSMSWLDGAFDSHKSDVMDLLQSVHQCTNYMQQVCLTTTQIPIVKQTPAYIRGVEAFVLRVKELLYINDCDDAITVDLLLNKFEKSRSVPKKARVAAKEASTDQEGGGRKPRGSRSKKSRASDEENVDEE